MPSIVKLFLCLLALVAWTGLLAAGGSGWRAGWAASKFFGAWIGGILLVGLGIWAFTA